MPFAKVGAMPMASSSTPTKKHYNGTTPTRGGSKPRGITMEDLKKQTALRLAQEQNQVNGDPTAVVNVNSVSPTPPPSTQQPAHNYSSYGQQQSYPRLGYHNPHYAPPPQQPPPPPIPQRYQYNNMQQQYHQPMPPPPPPPPSMVPQQQPNYNYNGSGGYGAPPPSSDLDQASLQMGQSRYNPYEANNLAAGNNSKLPHGLTVHELKEMTKARLQAEAAEKEQGGDGSNRERGVSPLDFEVSSHNASRERAMSRDSTGRNSAVSFQQDQVNGSGSVDSSYIRPISHSPSHSHRYNNNNNNVSRTDTWDSASVASHNSNAYSENNYGSETASEVSMGANRTRSFTVPTFTSGEDYQDRDVFPGPSSMHSSPRMPSFDAAVGGNRRRAVTLSPNTGSILEDRPHHGTWTRDRLNIPTFNGSSSASVQARQRGYSPVLEQLGLEQPIGSSNGSDSVIGSSVFGSSFSEFNSTGTNSSEFLRESSSSETRVPAPPPGFRGSDPTALAFANDRQTAFSPDQSVQSVQDTFLSGSKNPWDDSNERRRLASVENLASDLGSILNLSGSDQRERANTYTFGSNFPPSLPEHGDQFSGNDGFAAKDDGNPFRY